MIAQPFLINRDCTPLLEKLDVHTGKHGVTIINVTVADALAQVQAETRVEYAFVIMATLQVGHQMTKSLKFNPIQEFIY